MDHLIAIATDFDGTLCEEKWPEIGEPNWEIINYLKFRRDSGAKIILWTCRTGQLLVNAVEWCKGVGLEFDAVNANLPEVIECFGGDSRKISATEYIEDLACTKFKLPYKKDRGAVTIEYEVDIGDSVATGSVIVDADANEAEIQSGILEDLYSVTYGKQEEA